MVRSNAGSAEGSGFDQHGWVSHVDLSDRDRKILCVIGDEPVGVGDDGGGQVYRVSGPQLVLGAEMRRTVRCPYVHRDEVEPAQHELENANFCRSPPT